MSKKLRSRQDKVAEAFIAPENVLHYIHGLTWKHPGLDDVEDGKMERHEAHAELRFEDIANNNVGVIPESLERVAEQLKAQLMHSLFSIVNQTCEKTGNVVDAKDIGIPDAFLQMLEKIEFSIDTKGNISYPQVHSADGMKIIKALEAQPLEYHQKMEKVINEKIATAQDRESQRKSKFRNESE
jgi:hypothetical protein